jgi:hypothetical protein
VIAEPGCRRRPDYGDAKYRGNLPDCVVDAGTGDGQLLITAAPRLPLRGTNWIGCASGDLEARRLGRIAKPPLVASSGQVAGCKAEKEPVAAFQATTTTQQIACLAAAQQSMGV